MADGQEQKASLAFTFQKKKVIQKVAVNVDERKDTGQLISGIEGSKIQVVGGDRAAEVKTFVIPKLENTYQSGVGPKKFTPSYKPPSSDANVDPGEDRFVQAASTAPVITEYGLQLRENRPGRSDDAPGPSNGAPGSTTAAALDARAFKESLDELPDEIEPEAYEAMPVEEFGKAMLRGMGWEEGMGVGRNRRKVDAIEYIRRPERLGLGAQPVALAADPNKPVKMGEKPQRQDLVLAPDADGRQRNIRKLDEQLVLRSTVLPGPQPGKAMRITAGPHAGLGCTALEALPQASGRPERWRVRLTASQEEVDVLASELGEKWDRDQEAAGRGGVAAQPTAPAAATAWTELHGSGSRSGNGSAAERGAAAESPPPGRRRRDDRDRDEHDEGGGGKRKYRDEQLDGERRPGEQEGAGRGPKKSRGSDFDRRDVRDEVDERQREQYDDYRDDRHRKHDDRHKQEKKEKKEKKDKKEKKEKKKKDRDRDRDRDRRGREGSPDSGSAGSPHRADEEHEAPPPRPAGPTWLFPNIKVRIVDKAVRGGKLYLKKGTVVDVHPGSTADVAVDDTGDVLRLPESALETVVPKHEGAPVLVVAGRHRGARGRLLQVNTSSGAAAVQLAADFSIVRLLLDDVAGFVGELDE